LTVTGDLTDARVDAGHLARLAFNRVAEDDRLEARRRACSAGGRSRREGLVAPEVAVAGSTG